ncbi:MAG: 5'/3'-nucleotidase SurE [Candidatus Cryptobacteroides sp.]|nr:5'/3'-nucleotidase SurE [Candidatus Cryptobacteroides sp.]
MMRILITNDDGYYAQGIHELVDILKPYGEITVVAPKYHQSGMSMAVSMGFKPIAVKELGIIDGVRWFYLDGTPASCVKFGIDNILTDAKPDVVVSGINHGSNAAMATLYSGTIGAAMEGAINGVKAIGVSLDDLRPESDFSAVREYLPAIFEKLVKIDDSRHGRFYNINFPRRPASQIKGVRVAHLGFIHWEDEYQDYDPCAAEKFGYSRQKMGILSEPPLEEGERRYMMAGRIVEDPFNDAESDHRLCKEGYITISTQNIDNTDYAGNSQLVACGLESDFR